MFSLFRLLTYRHVVRVSPLDGFPCGLHAYVGKHIQARRPLCQLPLPGADRRQRRHHQGWTSRQRLLTRRRQQRRRLPQREQTLETMYGPAYINSGAATSAVPVASNSARVATSSAAACMRQRQQQSGWHIAFDCILYISMSGMVMRLQSHLPATTAGHKPFLREFHDSFSERRKLRQTPAWHAQTISSKPAQRLAETHLNCLAETHLVAKDDVLALLQLSQQPVDACAKKTGPLSTVRPQLLRPQCCVIGRTNALYCRRPERRAALLCCAVLCRLSSRISSWFHTDSPSIW